MDLRAALRERFEVGRHPLVFLSENAKGAVSRVTFRATDGAEVGGWLVRPDSPPPWPVVLVIHAHGDRYDIGARELLDGRPALAGPLGPALAAGGIASLCLDLPCFGGRAGESESAAAKAALWRGGSLAGRMLGELSSQMDWLDADPRFGRVAIFGMSMGATLGYWLAAVEPRVAALAQLCCLADFGALIESGAHDLHGIYLTVPDLPALARNGQIAGMVAPRPQLVCLGAQDPLTPPRALEIALSDLAKGYADAPGALEVLVDPDVGHQETPEMRARVHAFLSTALA